MATRKTRKAMTEPSPVDALELDEEALAEPESDSVVLAVAAAEPDGSAEAEEASAAALAESAESAEAEAANADEPDPAGIDEHQPRFHFFLIDAGWRSTSAKVLRDNFHMIREFQNNDPLYVLTQEQSIQLIRANPELIGKDPLIIVHDLQAKGGRGESGYHGFRLCLGLIKDSDKALEVLQEFLRFVHLHRRSADIEMDIRQRLHRAGMEGALEVLREGASSMME